MSYESVYSVEIKFSHSNISIKSPPVPVNMYVYLVKSSVNIFQQKILKRTPTGFEKLSFEKW